MDARQVIEHIDVPVSFKLAPKDGFKLLMKFLRKVFEMVLNSDFNLLFAKRVSPFRCMVKLWVKSEGSLRDVSYAILRVKLHCSGQIVKEGLIASGEVSF